MQIENVTVLKCNLLIVLNLSKCVMPQDLSLPHLEIQQKVYLFCLKEGASPSTDIPIVVVFEVLSYCEHMIYGCV